jgi:hypothetical protein
LCDCFVSYNNVIINCDKVVRDMIVKRCEFCNKPLLEKDAVKAIYKRHVSYWHNSCHEQYFNLWLDRVNPKRIKNNT